MADYSDGIQEFTVQVRKNAIRKLKNLRMLFIQSKPFLQLLSRKTRHIKEIDISGAVKSFYSFAPNNASNTVKLIRKEGTIELTVLDKSKFLELTTVIDQMLLKYHQIQDIDVSKNVQTNESRSNHRSASMLSSGTYFSTHSNSEFSDSELEPRNITPPSNIPKVMPRKKRFIENPTEIISRKTDPFYVKTEKRHEIFSGNYENLMLLPMEKPIGSNTNIEDENQYLEGNMLYLEDVPNEATEKYNERNQSIYMDFVNLPNPLEEGKVDRPVSNVSQIEELNGLRLTGLPKDGKTLRHETSLKEKPKTMPRVLMKKMSLPSLPIEVKEKNQTIEEDYDFLDAVSPQLPKFPFQNVSNSQRSEMNVNTKMNNSTKIQSAVRIENTAGIIPRQMSKDIFDDEGDFCLIHNRLRNDITMQNDISLQLDKNACQHIKIVAVDDRLWIANEIQENGKVIAYTGDLIVSVNNADISDILRFQQISKSPPLLLTVKRLPNAKVFLCDGSRSKDIQNSKKFYIFKESSNKDHVITHINGVNAVNQNNKKTVEKLIRESSKYVIIIQPKKFIKLLIVC